MSVPIFGRTPRVEQVRGRDHAAELVAVGQRVDQHVRAGPAGLETVHVVDAGVALPVGRKVARQHFQGGEVLVHCDFFQMRWRGWLLLVTMSVQCFAPVAPTHPRTEIP